MKTLVLSQENKSDIETAGEIIRNGGLVAIPTETVYGLAANALKADAVRKIFAAKGRPADNPLIVHISDFSQLAPLVKEVPEAAKKLAERFWAGPLTIILPKSEIVPEVTSGGLDTVAVRFPAHPTAQAVINAAGVPLAAPSANPSGKPSPTSFSHVKEDLMGKVDALLDGGDCSVGVESTVITLATPVPTVLRPGGVTVSELKEVLGEVKVDPAVLDKLDEHAKVSSPGMKYKHYSPKAEITIVDASPEEYADYVNQKKNCHALCFGGEEAALEVPYVSYGGRYSSELQAHRLFSALHELDALGAKEVYAHIPSKKGVGLAVYNRLIRAAGFKVINPKNHHIIGLTGQSGAGKSTVAELLKNEGCFVIDCDAVTKAPDLYSGDCLEQVKKAFGEDVAEAGVLNRALLASRAFSSSDGKNRLEGIVFPKIIERIKNLVKEAEEAGERLIVLDAPTLFEAGLDSACSRIIVVTAPESERLPRIIKRDGITEEAAKLRFSAQKDASFYEDRADYIIKNTDSEKLSDEVSRIVNDLKGEPGFRL